MDDKIYELPIGAVVHLVRGMVEGLMDRVKKIEDKMGDFFVEKKPDPKEPGEKEFADEFGDTMKVFLSREVKPKLIIQFDDEDSSQMVFNFTESVVLSDHISDLVHRMGNE